MDDIGEAVMVFFAFIFTIPITIFVLGLWWEFFKASLQYVGIL